jgi:hypothetical protein
LVVSAATGTLGSLPTIAAYADRKNWDVALSVRS